MVTETRAAMQAALAYVRWQAFGECRTADWDGAPPTAAEIDTLLVAALAQPEQAEPVAWFRRDQLQHIGGGGLVSAYPNTDNRTDLVPLYAAPQQPEPTKYEFAARGTLASLKCWHRLSSEEADDLVRFFAAKELSDEEIRKLQAQHPVENDPMPFARAVELAVVNATSQPTVQVEPIGDIRALKYRIHELEGEVIGYKRILDETVQLIDMNHAPDWFVIMARAALSMPTPKPVAYTSDYEMSRLASGHSASVLSAKFGMGNFETVPLYATPQQPAPGWQQVPIEPTDAMLDAARAVDLITIRSVYAEMLKAAPKATGSFDDPL